MSQEEKRVTRDINAGERCTHTSIGRNRLKQTATQSRCHLHKSPQDEHRAVPAARGRETIPPDPEGSGAPQFPLQWQAQKERRHKGCTGCSFRLSSSLSFCFVNVCLDRRLLSSHSHLFIFSLFLSSSLGLSFFLLLIEKRNVRPRRIHSRVDWTLFH